jgi:hypothetical protein
MQNAACNMLPTATAQNTQKSTHFYSWYPSEVFERNFLNDLYLTKCNLKVMKSLDKSKNLPLNGAPSPQTRVAGRSGVGQNCHLTFYNGLNGSTDAAHAIRISCRFLRNGSNWLRLLFLNRGDRRRQPLNRRHAGFLENLKERHFVHKFFQG